MGKVSKCASTVYLYQEADKGCGCASCERATVPLIEELDADFAL